MNVQNKQKCDIFQLHIDINNYQSTINELQLKLIEENNPFYLGKKQFNSEELRRVHQEQIDQLETLLQEKTKTTATLVRIENSHKLNSRY